MDPEPTARSPALRYLHLVVCACIASAVLQGTAIAYNLLFSTRFFGGMVMRHLKLPFYIAEVCAGLAALTVLVSYIADISYWPSRTARRVAIGHFAFFVACFALTAAEKMPSLPIALFVLGMPLLALFVGNTVLSCYSSMHALLILSLNFAVIAIALMFLYPFFYVGDTFFSLENQHAWLVELGCTADCTEAAFIMWISPAALAAISSIYAVVLALISLSIRHISPWAVARLAIAMRKSSATEGADRFHATVLGALSDDRRNKSQRQILAAAKMVSAAFLFLMCVCYVAAAMAPAGTKLSRAIIALCCAAVLAIVLVLVCMFGAEELQGAALQQPLVRLTLGYLRTDSTPTQALAAFAASPLFALYLALAVANQSARKLAHARYGAATFTKPLDADEARLLLTKRASAHLSHVRDWPWASVLVTVNYLAIVAWVLLYGSTLTYMAMAVLIGWLKTMHWLLASLMFFVVGIVMFLLPPVPGLAVYLTAGILLTPACEAPFGGEPFGFWLACGYSAFLAYLMKLAAQVMQQKGIGEHLGQSLYVRSTVQVNSRLIKAIRLILQRKGLSLAKICVLCGGPDWPTAVLTGILGCDVWQMLLGLSPIWMLTVPTSMAGAFQLRVGEDESWAAAASVMLLVAGGVQLVLGLLMLYFIEEVKTHSGETLDAIEDDAEVAAQEARDEAAQAAFQRATALATMPCAPKALLCGGTLVTCASAYMLMFAASSCFEDFALTDHIDDVLCLDCPRAAIKPLGFVALGMLGFGIVCLVLFNHWAGGRVRAQAAALV